MKKVIKSMSCLIFVYCLFVQTPVQAGTLNLISSLDLPGFDINNIASDGTNIIVIDGNETIKYLDLTGNVLKSIGTGSLVQGITYNGSRVVVTQGNGVGFAELNPISETLESIGVTGAIGPDYRDLAFDGSNLLAVGRASRGSNPSGELTWDVVKYDADTYAHLGALPLPVISTGSRIAGADGIAAWYNNSLFLTAEASFGQGSSVFIYQLDDSYNHIDTFSFLADQPVTGVAFLGNDLLVSQNSGNNSHIYRYSLGDPDLNVVPEPATFVLLGAGMLAGFFQRKKIFN